MRETNGMFTLTGAASYLGVSRQTIYNWIKAGKLYPIRIMGLPYLPISEVNKLLNLSLKKSRE